MKMTIIDILTIAIAIMFASFLSAVLFKAVYSDKTDVNFVKEYTKNCEKIGLYIIEIDLDTSEVDGMYQGYMKAGAIVDGLFAQKEYFVRQDQSGEMKMYSVYKIDKEAYTEGK